MKISEFTESEKARKPVTAPVKVLEAPDIDGEENREMPGVKANVQLVYSPEKGRHLVAAEPIKPGQESNILATEHWTSEK